MSESTSSTNDPSGKKKKEKVRADTVWKLVEASCLQLTQSVISARMPIVLLTTWALIWFVALYSTEFGLFRHGQVPLSDAHKKAATRLYDWAMQEHDAKIMHERIEKAFFAEYKNCHVAKDGVRSTKASLLRACVSQAGTAEARKLPLQAIELAEALTPIARDEVPQPLQSGHDYCTRLLTTEPHSKGSTGLTRSMINDCKTHAVKRLDSLFPQQLQDTFVSLPLGIGKISVNDLGLIGNITLLLLLTWVVLSAQAENNAIRSFVDFDRANFSIFRSPSVIVLTPRNPRYQAEHLAFAYHAVRARFFNVFSQQTRPLKIWTMLVLAFPIAIAAWQFYTDITWILDAESQTRYPDFFPIALKRTFIETVLVTAAIFLWYRANWLTQFTSELLHAWEIATLKVWMFKWNEAIDEDPDMVRLDLSRREVLSISPVQWPLFEWGATRAPGEPPPHQQPSPPVPPAARTAD